MAVRWGLWLLGFVALVAAAAPAALYVASEAVLHHHYPLPRFQPISKSGPDGVARGQRLAIIYGCTDCHGDDLRGRDFPHPAPFSEVHSANLTLKARHYSDEDFARSIRQGLGPTGESVEFMPSPVFAHMSDPDVAAIVAYIRSLPSGGADRPYWVPTWRARWQLVHGDFPPGVALMAEAARQTPANLGPKYAQGRYLVSVTCVECHGPTLKGQPGGPPDLTIAGAYGPADFARLMKTGVAAGGRQVGMMSAVARKRFSHFTDDEVAAIRGYLAARAQAETEKPKATPG
jgi:mono/diheme cytochrome c family protein